MAIYLIDYENTSVKGLTGIEKLKEEDLVIIFYGPKTGAVPFDEHVKISTASSHVEYIKTTKTAKNYLDFQLTSYLGYLIATTAVKNYYIISRDSGYDSAVDFWTKRGIQVKRMENVAGLKKEKKAAKETNMAKSVNQSAKTKQSEIIKQAGDAKPAEMAENPVIKNDAAETTPVTSQENKPNNPGSVPESVRKKIRNGLRNHDLQAGAYRQIYACMLKASDKQTFNTALVRSFTQEKGNILYKAILPIFNEWMKS